MNCAFDLERPEPFEDLDPGCQFDVAESELIELDGKTWCPFHLPMESADGTPSPKADWRRAKEKIEAFNEAIFAFIDKAKEKGEPADLTGVVFPGEILFTPYQDEVSALPTIVFFQAQFTDHTWFIKVQFSGDAWFREAQFNGIADFREIQIIGYISFEKAQFSDHAWFREARFSGPARFGEAQFSGDAQFRGAQFKGEANFEKARFRDEARFLEARFDGDAVFLGTTFFKKANFEATIFSNRALFNPAFFKKDANFAGAAEGVGKPKTIQDVKLTTQPAKTEPAKDGSVVIKGTVSEPPRPFGGVFGPADFSGAEFHAGADFNNRRFTDETLFRGTQFVKAPKFHNAVLHQDTDFTEAQFTDTTSEDAVRAYRTLKLAMGRVRAVDEEAMFYALEMESRRKREDTPISVKVFSRLYERAADYGRSFTRPLGWLGWTAGVFFLVYLICFAALTTGGLGEQDVGDIGRFTMRQIAPPFDAFTLGTTEGLPAGLSRLPLWLGFVATIQSILSLGLIALFILALRRRFRMG